MRIACLLLLGLLPLGPLPLGNCQDAEEGAPILSERATLARDLARAWGTRTFEVFQGEQVVERVVLTAAQVQRGEQHFLELVLDRHRPPGAEHPERLLTRLTLDDGLTPFEVRLWEATEERPQLANLAVAGGKLTGRARGKGVVRNVPEPVVSESSLILLAALVPREEDANLRFARLVFGQRGVTVELDERLVFDGFEDRDEQRVARIEHRDPRGRILGVLWFDAEGMLVQRSVGARDPLLWRLAVEEEDEREPR